MHTTLRRARAAREAMRDMLFLFIPKTETHFWTRGQKRLPAREDSPTLAA